jgi:hypothetical protein
MPPTLSSLPRQAENNNYKKYLKKHKTVMIMILILFEEFAIVCSLFNAVLAIKRF